MGRHSRSKLFYKGLDVLIVFVAVVAVIFSLVIAVLEEETLKQYEVQWVNGQFVYTNDSGEVTAIDPKTRDVKYVAAPAPYYEVEELEVFGYKWESGYGYLCIPIMNE